MIEFLSTSERSVPKAHTVHIEHLTNFLVKVLFAIVLASFFRSSNSHPRTLEPFIPHIIALSLPSSSSSSSSSSFTSLLNISPNLSSVSKYPRCQEHHIKRQYITSDIFSFANSQQTTSHTHTSTFSNEPLSIIKGIITSFHLLYHSHHTLSQPSYPLTLSTLRLLRQARAIPFLHGSCFHTQEDVLTSKQAHSSLPFLT